MSRGGRREYDRGGRHPPVLVADSYAGARVPCARFLERFNFQVDQAANGDEALGRVTARVPYIILCELLLPGMPAARLAQWLAQNFRTRGVPLIAMVGDVEEGGGEGRRLPVAGLLVKPFALVEMLDEVRRLLRQRRPN